MSKEVHLHFLSTAKAISKELYLALNEVGVVELSIREFIEGKKASLPELLIRSVIGQQLSNKAAFTIWQRLLALSDNLPLLDYINNCDQASLRSCGLSSAKIKTLRGIADAFLNEKLNDKTLGKLNKEERNKMLTSLWGIGPWTADMANIFYFLEEDIWPDKDIAAVNTLQKLIGDSAATNDIAKQFSPYRSYLALKMWRISDN